MSTHINPTDTPFGPPDPEPTHENNPMLIEGTWLVQSVGRHTCGTDVGGHYGAHEPGCGLEPIVDLATLPGWEALPHQMATPQDAREGGTQSPTGVPGGDRTSQGADGASGGSLGETIRAEAHRFPVELWGLVEGFARKADAARAAHQRDVQNLGRANAKLGRQVGAVEGLVHGWKRIQADNRAAMERGELVRKTPGPEDFLAVLDAINVHEACNRELSAALAMVDEARQEAEDESTTRRGLANRLTESENLLRQARGDLAAQEGIAQELQPIAQVVHTVRTRGGVGELPGVRIERVEDGTTASMRRAEKAEAAVERVRALLGEGDLFTPMDSRDAGEVFHAESVRDLIGDLRDALDGGTEAGRANGGPVDPGTSLVGADGIECLVPGVHVHDWGDDTTHGDSARGVRHYCCTLPGCSAQREEER